MWIQIFVRRHFLCIYVKHELSIRTWCQPQNQRGKATGAVTLPRRSAVMQGHVHHRGGRCTNFCSDSSLNRPDCDAAGRLETLPLLTITVTLAVFPPFLSLCIKQLGATSQGILGSIRRHFWKYGGSPLEPEIHKAEAEKAQLKCTENPKYVTDCFILM